MDFKSAKNLATTLSLCFFLSDTADAGKLYKIVGEDGKITFSQYPPDKGSNDDQSAGTVETVKVSGGGSTRVTQNGDREMCGEIQLPYRSDRSKSRMASHLDRVNDQVGYWKDKLTRLERQAADRSHKKLSSNSNTSSRYFSQGYQNSKDKKYLQLQNRDQKRIRDLRCAISWGNNINSEMADTRVQLNDEKSRLTAIRNDLENSMQSLCGDLPSYDPTDAQTTRQRSNWYTCSKRYRKEIRVVESKLNRF